MNAARNPPRPTLAYCKALGVGTAVLIYPEAAGGERYAVRDGETVLLAEGVELASDPAVIERGMGALLDRLMRASREASSRPAT